MKTELMPAVAAAVGGSAMLSVVVVTEARQAARMRAGRVPVRLTFPRGVEGRAVQRALDALGGLAPTNEIVAEIAASGQEITHCLHLPESVRRDVATQLRAAVPGLRVEAQEPEPIEGVVLRLGATVPAGAVLRTSDPEGASRALLASLLPLQRDETICLRWALRPGQPIPEPENPSAAWRAKTADPGMRVAGVLLIRASQPERARALAARVSAVLATRRGPYGALAVRPRRGGELPVVGRRSGWLSMPELAPLLAWPMGDEVPVGVTVGAARQVPARASLPRYGRPLLVADQEGEARPVALSPEAARHHVALLGATGSGKSSVLAAGVLSDLARGFGGVLMDPKGDTVRAVLERVPAAHANRVVVIDPSDPGPVPGVDLLGAGGDLDLKADAMLSVLHALSRDAWGPRIDSLLRLGLRTLAEVPGGTLGDWPALFMDASLRRRMVGHLRDPLLIGQWQAFESLSEAERAQHIAAPMSRVLALIGRPAVRAVLAQSNPKLDVGRLLEERRWLLVSTPSGVLGKPATRLIAATVTYVAWSAVAARAALPEAERHPIFLYFDEAQAVLDLGFGMEELLEQARGLAAGVTIATQAAGRLPEAIRSALLANVATLLSFRTGATEAARVAAELPGLTALDLQSLGAFEVAARVGVGVGAESAVVTGRTEPLPPPTGQAERVRRLSAERYGRSREEIEAAVQDRYGTSAEPVDMSAELGRARRQA